MTTTTTGGPARGRAAPLPPDQRRQAIVEAVLPTLIERGASATSRELAEAAGVSEGTIFKVFADKDELLAAALDRAVDQADIEHQIGQIDRSQPFEARLAEATELIQRRIVDIWRLVSQLGPRPHTHDRPPLPDIEALTELVASEPGRVRTEPSEAARLLRALVLAMSHPMLVTEPRPAAGIVDVFLHGVGSPS